MKNNLFLFFSFYCFLVFSQNFVQVNNKELVINNETLELKSIFFENDSRFLQSHLLYSQQDFQNVKNLHFNCIDLELISRSFEEKHQENQFTWLKKQIQFAKDLNLYLIFSLEKKDSSEFNTWEKIINEFKNEEQILAFNLGECTNDFVKKIRTIDSHHILISEQKAPFEKVNDSNILYNFDFFEPVAFTHQEKKWDNLKNNQKYPHEKKLEFPTDLQKVKIDTANTKFGTGRSDWTYYESKLMRLSDSLNQDTTLIGSPILSSSNASVGSIYFNEFVIEEVNENGNTNEVFRIYAYNSDNWKWISLDGLGGFKQVRSHDIDNNDVLVIQHTEELGYCYNFDFRFPIKKNHFYKISGWVKGDGISFEALNCFGFLVEKSINNRPILHRNKEYIEFYTKDFLAFQKKYNVPIYLKIGTKNNTFKQKRGGNNWIEDIKKIISPNGYSYYNYLSKDFGIYSTNKKGKKGNKKALEYFNK